MPPRSSGLARVRRSAARVVARSAGLILALQCGACLGPSEPQREKGHTADEAVGRMTAGSKPVKGSVVAGSEPLSSDSYALAEPGDVSKQDPKQELKPAPELARQDPY